MIARQYLLKEALGEIRKRPTLSNWEALEAAAKSLRDRIAMSEDSAQTELMRKAREYLVIARLTRGKRRERLFRELKHMREQHDMPEE